MLTWQEGKNRIFTKVISLVIAQAFLFTSVVYPAPSERSLFKDKRPDYKAIQEQREQVLQQRKDVLSGKKEIKKSPYKQDLRNRIKLSSLKDLSSIYIPDSLGRVVEVYQATSDKRQATRPLVVHIQDLHTNPEAQYNEASILEILIKDYDLGLVCSEGAEGEVDTSSVSSFPDPEVREKTARLFVNSGELTAEEYLSITKYPDLPIWGIEDKDIYFQNIIEFNKIMKFSPDAQVFIGQVKEVLETLKPEIYSKKLLEIDAKETEYEENRIETNEYLDYLLDLCSGFALEHEKYKNIAVLKETLEFEKKIDQQKIMQESQRLLVNLQEILSERGNKSEIETLLAKASLFKDQKISPFSFYSYLDELTRRHLKEDLEKYRDLLDFVMYLEKVNSLDSIKLFQEIEELTYETKDFLSEDEHQKLLTRALRHIKFLENFFNLKVSNEELDYYLANRDEFKVSWFKSIITLLRQGSGGQAGYIDYNPNLIDIHLSELEHFYQIAKERDMAMVDNAVSEIEKRNVKVSALVAGGFHTRGLTQLLREKGYSYVVISPYSSTDIDEENYHFLLSGKRKPISELINQLDSYLRVILTFSRPEFRSFLEQAVEEAKEDGIEISWTDSAKRIMEGLVVAGIRKWLGLGRETDFIEENLKAAFPYLKLQKLVGIDNRGTFYARVGERYLKITEDRIVDSDKETFDKCRKVKHDRIALAQEPSPKTLASNQNLFERLGILELEGSINKKAITRLLEDLEIGDSLEKISDKIDRTVAVLRKLVKVQIGKSDIVIGMPNYDETETAVHVMKTIIAGLKAYYPDKKVTFVSMGEMAAGEKNRKILEALQKETKDIDGLNIITLRRSPEYDGKGAGAYLMMNIADELSCEAFAHLDADLWTKDKKLWAKMKNDYPEFKDEHSKERFYKENYLQKINWDEMTIQEEERRVKSEDIEGLSPYWIKGLLEPIYNAREEGKRLIYVTPWYIRSIYDATITNFLMRLMATVIYKINIEQPIGGDFAYSGELVKELLKEKALWKNDKGFQRFGFDNGVTWLTRKYSSHIIQSFLGKKLHKQSARLKERMLIFNNPDERTSFTEVLKKEGLIKEYNKRLKLITGKMNFDKQIRELLIKRKLPLPNGQPIFENIKVTKDGFLETDEDGHFIVEVDNLRIMFKDVFTTSATLLIKNVDFWEELIGKEINETGLFGMEDITEKSSAEIIVDYKDLLDKFIAGFEVYEKDLNAIYPKEIDEEIQKLVERAKLARENEKILFIFPSRLYASIVLETYKKYVQSYISDKRDTDLDEIPYILEPLWRGYVASFVNNVNNGIKNNGISEGMKIAKHIMEDLSREMFYLWDTRGYGQKIAGIIKAPGTIEAMGKFYIQEASYNTRHGVIVAKLLDLENPQEGLETVIIKAQRASPGFFNKNLQDLLAMAKGNQAVRQIINWYVTDFQLKEKGVTLILEDNKKGVLGLGSGNIVAVSHRLMNNPIALFHEIGHAYLDAHPEEIKPIFDQLDVGRKKWIKGIDKRIFHSTRHSIRTHYILRAFQRQVFENYDEYLTETIKKLGVTYSIKETIEKPKRPALVIKIRKRHKEETKKAIRKYVRLLKITGLMFIAGLVTYLHFEPSKEAVKVFRDMRGSLSLGRVYEDPETQHRNEVFEIRKLQINDKNLLNEKETARVERFLNARRIEAINFTAQKFNLEPEYIAAFLYEEKIFKDSHNRLKYALRKWLSEEIAPHLTSHKSTVGRGQINESYLINRKFLGLLYENRDYFLAKMEKEEERRSFNMFIKNFKEWDNPKIDDNTVLGHLTSGLGKYGLLSLLETEDIDIFLVGFAIREIEEIIFEANKNVVLVPDMFTFTQNSKDWIVSEYKPIPEGETRYGNLFDRYGKPFGGIKYYSPLMRHFAVGVRYYGGFYGGEPTYLRSRALLNTYLMFLRSGVFKVFKEEDSQGADMAMPLLLPAAPLPLLAGFGKKGQGPPSDLAARVEENVKELRSRWESNPDSFIVKSGQEGVDWVLRRMQDDPDCYIGFGDMMKIALMNYSFTREIVDKLIPAMVGAADIILKKYGGNAVRTGGDEMALVLPSKFNWEEVNNIRLELQATLGLFLSGKYTIARVKGITDDNIEGVNDRLGRDGLTGVYKDKDGFFMVFDKTKPFTDKVEIAGRPVEIPSPRSSFGIVRASAKHKDVHANYGISIRHAEYVRNIANENGWHGATREVLGELDKFDEDAEEPTIPRLSNEERRKIADNYRRLGIELYFDQIEEYYPVVKREYLYYVIQQMPGTPIGSTVLVRGPPDNFYAVTKADNGSIRFIKLELVYEPYGELKESIDSAIKNGRYTREDLRQRWPDQDFYGFKMINEFYDHGVANKVILEESNILDSMLSEKGRDIMDVADEIAGRINNEIKNTGVKAKAEVILNCMRVDPKNIHGGLIDDIDNMAKVAEGLTMVETDKKNIVKIFDESKKSEFEKAVRRNRVNERKKFLPILYDIYSKPVLNEKDLDRHALFRRKIDEKFESLLTRLEDSKNAFKPDMFIDRFKELEVALALSEPSLLNSFKSEIIDNLPQKVKVKIAHYIERFKEGDVYLPNLRRFFEMTDKALKSDEQETEDYIEITGDEKRNVVMRLKEHLAPSDFQYTDFADVSIIRDKSGANYIALESIENKDKNEIKRERLAYKLGKGRASLTEIKVARVTNIDAPATLSRLVTDYMNDKDAFKRFQKGSIESLIVFYTFIRDVDHEFGEKSSFWKPGEQDICISFDHGSAFNSSIYSIIPGKSVYDIEDFIEEYQWSFIFNVNFPYKIDYDILKEKVMEFMSITDDEIRNSIYNAGFYSYEARRMIDALIEWRDNLDSDLEKLILQATGFKIDLSEHKEGVDILEIWGDDEKAREIIDSLRNMGMHGLPSSYLDSALTSDFAGDAYVINEKAKALPPQEFREKLYNSLRENVKHGAKEMGKMWGRGSKEELEHLPAILFIATGSDKEPGNDVVFNRDGVSMWSKDRDKKLLGKVEITKDEYRKIIKDYRVKGIPLGSAGMYDFILDEMTEIALREFLMLFCPKEIFSTLDKTRDGYRAKPETTPVLKKNPTRSSL